MSCSWAVCILLVFVFDVLFPGRHANMRFSLPPPKVKGSPQAVVNIEFGDATQGLNGYTSSGLGFGVLGLSTAGDTENMNGYKLLDRLVSENQILSPFYSLGLEAKTLILGGVDTTLYKGNPVELQCSSTVHSGNG
jgi:hypothetical protein